MALKVRTKYKSTVSHLRIDKAIVSFCKLCVIHVVKLSVTEFPPGHTHFMNVICKMDETFAVHIFLRVTSVLSLTFEYFARDVVQTNLRNYNFSIRWRN